MLRFVLFVVLVAKITLASTIQYKDLPLKPEVSCATQEIRSAFSSCAISGATAACCQRLDGIFANSTSPSNGCLCYPQVLYKTAVKGAQSNFDVLGLLNRCQLSHGLAFETQWAAAEQTSCPDIPLSATAADIITLMQQEVILPASRMRPQWAWSNLLQFGEVNQHLSDVETVWQQLFGLHTVKYLLLVIISTAPLFLFMHGAVLCKLSPAYNSLSPAERMIVCQHSVYAVVFGLSVVPQTVLAFMSMFKSWTGDYFASPHLPALCGLFLASRAMLYLVEASVRTVIKRSWLLMVHHQLFFLIVLMGVWTQNTAVLGIGLVLDLFACHEAPLYVALLAYRLNWKRSLTGAVLRVACAWYICTRVFQTIAIIYMIVGFSSMPAIKTTPEFIVTALLFGAFTIIQVYTVFIYGAIYRKVCAASDSATSKGSKRQSAKSLTIEIMPA